MLIPILNGLGVEPPKTIIRVITTVPAPKQEEMFLTIQQQTFYL